MFASLPTNLSLSGSAAPLQTENGATPPTAAADFAGLLLDLVPTALLPQTAGAAAALPPTGNSLPLALPDQALSPAEPEERAGISDAVVPVAVAQLPLVPLPITLPAALELAAQDLAEPEPGDSRLGLSESALNPDIASDLASTVAAGLAVDLRPSALAGLPPVLPPVLEPGPVPNEPAVTGRVPLRNAATISLSALTPPVVQTGSAQAKPVKGDGRAVQAGPATPRVPQHGGIGQTVKNLTANAANPPAAPAAAHLVIQLPIAARAAALPAHAVPQSASSLAAAAAVPAIGGTVPLGFTVAPFAQAATAGFTANPAPLQALPLAAAPSALVAPVLAAPGAVSALPNAATPNAATPNAATPNAATPNAATPNAALSNPAGPNPALPNPAAQTAAVPIVVPPAQNSARPGHTFKGQLPLGASRFSTPSTRDPALAAKSATAALSGADLLPAPVASAAQPAATVTGVPTMAAVPFDQTATLATGTSVTPPRDFAALIERIETAREASGMATTALSIRHEEFGTVGLRIEAEQGRLAVALHNTDPDFARAVAAAQPGSVETPRTDGVRADTARGDSGANGTARDSNGSGHPPRHDQAPRSADDRRPGGRSAQAKSPDQSDLYA